MLAAQRKDLILATLRRDGRVVAKDLAAELDLSEDTIRRDLRELAAEGRLHRVHGGALPASPAVADFTVRTGIGQAAKVEVGRLAAAWSGRGRRSRSTGVRRRSSSPGTCRATSRRPWSRTARPSPSSSRPTRASR